MTLELVISYVRQNLPNISPQCDLRFPWTVNHLIENLVANLIMPKAAKPWLFPSIGRPKRLVMLFFGRSWKVQTMMWKMIESCFLPLLAHKPYFQCWLLTFIKKNYKFCKLFTKFFSNYFTKKCFFAKAKKNRSLLIYLV